MCDLKEIFKKAELEIYDEQIKKFEIYKDLLISYNKVMNLTAITETKEIYIKHFLDSVLPMLTGYIRSDMKIVDVGCGAGFPSIPLKIYKDDLNFTLIDSLNKRLNFINEVIKETNLKNIKTVHGRAEDLAREKNYRETFDIAVARAVAPLNILLEYCTPFVKVGGYFIALKGKGKDEEIKNAINAEKKLNVRIKDTFDMTLPGTDNERSIIVFEKFKNTPDNFPRSAGKPTKKPL